MAKMSISQFEILFDLVVYNNRLALYHIAVEANPHRLVVFGNLQGDVCLACRIQDTGQIRIVCLALPPRLIPSHLLGNQFVGVIAKFVESLGWYSCGWDYNLRIFVNKQQQKSLSWKTHNFKTDNFVGMPHDYVALLIFDSPRFLLQMKPCFE